MSENVIIFGAGASMTIGAPLMSGFLDKTEDYLLKGGFDKDNTKLLEIYKKIRQLQVVHSKSYIDLDNIEAIFGAIEMGNIIGRYGDARGGDINEIRNGFISLIVKTLEESVGFTLEIPRRSGSRSELESRILGLTPADVKFHPANDYGTLIDSLRQLTGGVELGDFAFITFNYDIALEQALYASTLNKYHKSVVIDYALESNKTSQLSTQILKLHGSLNWYRCSSCQEIIILDVEKYIHEFMDDILAYAKDNLSEEVPIRMSNREEFLKKIHTHSGKFSFTPVLVPPTWTKSEYQKDIKDVWKMAAEELSDARNIYIVGYSLPETDSFFRYLYALGTVSPLKIQRFWVFNPDTSEETINRYMNMIGRDVLPRFRYYPKNAYEFADGIKHYDSSTTRGIHMQTYYGEGGWENVRQPIG